MKAIKLLRFFTGYIEFEATGGFNERFINLCNFHKVNIFDITYKDNSVSARIAPKDIYKLKSPAKKSGIKLKFISRNGMYFLCKKYSRRLGLAVGAFIYFIFCALMQQFVWCIDIQPSRNVSRQDIKELLYDNGLHQGTHISSFDEIECSRRIVNTLEGKLQWMAINIKGSKAFVEIHDYDKDREDNTYGPPSNIIADFDGILMSIEAFTGETAAKAGSGVNKGDLLISGIVENRDLSASFFDATGKVTALHNVNFTYTYNPPEVDRKITDIHNKTALYFLGIKIPLNYIRNSNSSKAYSNRSFVNYSNTDLPIGICKNHIPDFADTKKQTDKEKDTLAALSLYTENTYKKFENSNIISCSHSFDFLNDRYKITSVYSCIDFIGVKQPIKSNIF